MEAIGDDADSRPCPPTSGPALSALTGWAECPSPTFPPVVTPPPGTWISAPQPGRWGRPRRRCRPRAGRARRAGQPGAVVAGWARHWRWLAHPRGMACAAAARFARAGRSPCSGGLAIGFDRSPLAAWWPARAPHRRPPHPHPAQSPPPHRQRRRATCVDANIASTAAMVRGAGAAAWLKSTGLPARLVTHDGLVVHLNRWPMTAELAA